MANLRTIKKDIDFLVEEIISDCCLYTNFNPGKKESEVEAILLEAVNLRNDLFDRVNAAPKEKAKQHYTNISKDLLEGIDKLFEKISGLSK